MKSSRLGRRMKIAFLLGVTGVAVVAAFFIQSADRQLALHVLAGPELQGLAGDVKFSYPSSFKIRIGDERYSRITYYVFGSRKHGFLTVVLTGSTDGLYVQSATFDGAPLVVQSDHRRVGGGT